MSQTIFKNKFKKAFTIVELLVVIVVIGILAGIVLVTYRGVTQKANDAVAIADLNNAQKKLKILQVENMGYPDSLDKINCTNPTYASTCIKLSAGDSYVNYQANNSVFPQTFCLTIKSANNTKKRVSETGLVEDMACSFAFAGTNLTASATSRSSISLSWGAVTSATSYNIQRDTSPSFSSPTTLTPTSSTSMASTGLTQSTTYYFRVNAVVDGDTSDWSNTANATTTAFLAPTGLAATATSTTNINLSWNAVSGATAYTLQRSTDPSFVSPAPTVVATTLATTASSSGLTQGTTYYYRISVTDTDGTSGWSSNASAKTYTQYSQTFATLGAQNFTIPASVTSVKLEVWGAKGGDGGCYIADADGSTIGCGGGGGYGGYASGYLAVTPGQVLSLYVGTAGNNGTDGAEGYTSSGNGATGGESYVKLGATYEARGYGGTGGIGYTGGGGGGSNGSGWLNTPTITTPTSILAGQNGGNGSVRITYTAP